MSSASGATVELEKLEAVEAQMRDLERRRVQLIATAQRHGASWRDISSVLGVSRQAAWEMYRNRAREILDATAERATLSEDEVLASASAALRGIRARRRRR
jgi:hypothetical protein